MSNWIFKLHEECDQAIVQNKVNHQSQEMEAEDNIFVYNHDHSLGTLRLICHYILDAELNIIQQTLDERNIDLPYSVLYKTRTSDVLLKLTTTEYNFIFELAPEDTPTDDTLNTLRLEPLDEYSFPYLNILFKGVPGTGKSRIIDDIVEKKLKLVSPEQQKNILRVNIHSASSNADLMQGIGITTENNNVVYKEKQGLIYEHIRKACYSPNQPFVLILEEIQENSLNELIGDLIYLIEPTKRLKINQLLTNLTNRQRIAYLGDGSLVEKYLGLAREGSIAAHSVKIPFLVEANTEYREMILPHNLYIFCTSNYRDDKKVIEDNLLRRFEVIELYPQYTDAYKDSSGHIAIFLEKLNSSILTEFINEIHPDRFQSGHANWLNIEKDDIKSFYKALLKVFIEFKEIKEVESKAFLRILTKTKEEISNESWLDPFLSDILIKFGNPPSYSSIVQFLQEKIYNDEIFDTTEENN